MSFWDRYLAPGDLRARRQSDRPPPRHSTGHFRSPDEPDHPGQSPPPPPRIDAARRARRQNGLLYGGLAFTLLSLVITRRALRRKLMTAPPPTPSAGNTTTSANALPQTPPKVDGGLEAVEALGLATLNVFSVAMAAAGGFAKYFDIGGIEDMRDQIRRGVGYDVYGGTSEADKEMEAWVAEVLSRKDGVGKLKEGIAEKLFELDQMDVERRAKEKGKEARLR